jgi:ABC-type multidrug transport system fused ATPase/permease subunit
MQMMSALFVVAVGVAAGLMALNGGISFGQLITVVGLTQFVMGPLSYLGTNFGANWNAAVPCAKRVLSVLQAPPSTQAGDLRDAQGDITFRSMTAGRVTDLDLALPGAGVTAIVCPAEVTEALTGVLARKKMPDAGVVEVGGVNLFDLHRDVVRSRVRTVPHASDLFEGSVLENIGAGVPDEVPDRDSRITRAIFAAACDDVADVLPAGLDTPVGEAGQMLSGGQRQRVALARALAAESDVLVLNDPTTAVDSVTEATVAERLQMAREHRCTIVFTSSPALLEIADHLVMFDGDRVSYQGEPSGLSSRAIGSNR